MSAFDKFLMVVLAIELLLLSSSSPASCTNLAVYKSGIGWKKLLSSNWNG
jgi:hypothetical protein